MIYLDNNATTKVAQEVFAAMKPYLTEFYGNPSSAYTLANKSKSAISESRKNLATLLGASDPNEIVFTSGGTESDNWSIFGTLEANPDKTHIITTRVEHEAVRKVCERLEANGFEVSWLDVNRDGQLELDQLKTFLRNDTAIVSTMLANNETGVLFPVEEIAKIVKENSDATFHVDGVNAVGKVPINLKNTQIDLFSISGHKFYAPKGIGALYIRDSVQLPSIKIGGGQEMNRRAGTEAIHQIVGIGEAAKLVANMEHMKEVRSLRDKLENEILDKIPFSRLNGDKIQRLPNTSNISFENINGEAVLAKLNDLGVFVSTGSACNEFRREASPVLKAMDIPYKQAMGSIRFSFGIFNTEEDVDFVLKNLPSALEGVRKHSI